MDADVLDAVVGAFCWTRTQVVGGRWVIALDGKTVRGARTPTTVKPHLVAAFDHAAGTVLGQVALAAKSNEIPAVRDLLGLFDLDQVVVTVDAMHTGHDTATLIVAAGGDYVFTVKSNQPSLYAACKNLPWAQVTSHSTVSTGHGRRARRTIKVLTAPAWITFPHATQIARSGAPSPPPAAGPWRSSTSSPPPTTALPHRPHSRRGCAGTGVSRTPCTGLLTALAA